MKQIRQAIAIISGCMLVILSGCRATATSPPTAGSNAADSYREAVKLVDAAIYSDQFDRYLEGNFDQDAAAFFARNGRIADLVRVGAACSMCDWNVRANGYTSLNALRGVANFSVARARFERAQGDTAGALDDLLAAVAMGRHVAADPLLVSQLVEDGIENLTIQDLARLLPELNKQQLQSLPARLNALPKASTGPEMMMAEFEFERKNAREHKPDAMDVATMDSVELLSGAMSDAWNQPPREFARIVEAKSDKLKLDPTATRFGTVMVEIHEDFAVTAAKQAMLFTAIDILTRGEAAVRDSHDPLGSGPFGYVKTARGFELTSKYKQNDRPVKLVVGQ